MENRVIDIRNYWSSVVRDTAEFQQIAAAVNPELNTLQECIYRILKDAFIHDATEYGVKRWENILNITPDNGDSLDDRKVRILTYLNIRLPYTLPVLKLMLESFVGAGNYTVDDILHNRAELNVGLNNCTDSQVRAVRALLLKVAPQNLVVNINGVPIVGYERMEYVDVRTQILLDWPVTYTGALDVELDLLYNHSEYEGGTHIQIISTQSKYWFLSTTNFGGEFALMNDAPTFIGNINHVQTNHNGYRGSNNKRLQIHVHDMGYTVDGTFYPYESGTPTVRDDTGVLILGSRDARHGGRILLRYYSCRIREKDVLKADLVPAKRTLDGAHGLWCKVRKKFYGINEAAIIPLDWEDEFNIEEVVENE